MAFGSTSEVYTLAQNKILKLYDQTIESELVDHEANMTAIAYGAGLTLLQPLARCYLRNRDGLLYSQINGNDMATCLRRKPWRLRQYSHLFVDHHLTLLRCDAPTDFPLVTDKILHYFQATELFEQPLQLKLQRYLNLSSSGSSVCHLDFNLKNLIIHGEQTTLIDWYTAGRGEAEADIAACWLRLQGLANGAGELNVLERQVMRYFARTYAKRCVKAHGVYVQKVLHWLPLMAFWLVNEAAENRTPFLIQMADPEHFTSIPEVRQWLI